MEERHLLLEKIKKHSPTTDMENLIKYMIMMRNNTYSNLIRNHEVINKDAAIGEMKTYQFLIDLLSPTYPSLNLALTK